MSIEYKLIRIRLQTDPNRQLQAGYNEVVAVAGPSVCSKGVSPLLKYGTDL